MAVTELVEEASLEFLDGEVEGGLELLGDLLFDLGDGGGDFEGSLVAGFDGEDLGDLLPKSFGEELEVFFLEGDVSAVLDGLL